MEVTRERVADVVKSNVSQGRQATVLMAFGLPPFNEPMSLAKIAELRGDGMTSWKVHHQLYLSMPELSSSKIWNAFAREFERPKSRGRKPLWGKGIAECEARYGAQVGRKSSQLDAGEVGFNFTAPFRETNDAELSDVTEKKALESEASRQRKIAHQLRAKAAGLTAAQNRLKARIEELEALRKDVLAATAHTIAKVSSQRDTALEEVRNLMGQVEHLREANKPKGFWSWLYDGLFNWS